MLIFGHKPSSIRHVIVAVLVALAAIVSVVALSFTGFPQVAAIVATVATVLNGLVVGLQRNDVASAIDNLDNS